MHQDPAFHGTIKIRQKLDGDTITRPGSTEDQYWTECPMCETKTLYFRKKVGDYRCVTCKRVFTKGEIEHV